MSNFDETMLNRLKQLEREVERLKAHGAHKAGMYADTYFDDLQYGLVGQKMESPSSHIVVSPLYVQVVYNKSCSLSDYTTMAVQMSHRWKTGTVIYPHVHWIQTAAAMPNLLISYAWNINGAQENQTFTYQKHTANAFTWSTGNLNQITKFGSITPPEGAGLSDIVLFKIFRDVANTSTLFTGGAEVDNDVQDFVGILSFDVHFEIDSAGSDTEYVK